MTIRIIVRTDDAAMACNVGGTVLSEFRTFDVELPELEAFLRGQPVAHPSTKYDHRQVIGVEIVEKAIRQ